MARQIHIREFASEGHKCDLPFEYFSTHMNISNLLENDHHSDSDYEICRGRWLQGFKPDCLKQLLLPVEHPAQVGVGKNSDLTGFFTGFELTCYLCRCFQRVSVVLEV